MRDIRRDYDEVRSRLQERQGQHDKHARDLQPLHKRARCSFPRSEWTIDTSRDHGQSWSTMIPHAEFSEMVVSTDETVFTSETEMLILEKNSVFCWLCWSTKWFLCRLTCPSYV